MTDTLAKISTLDFATASSLASRCESCPLLLQNFVDNNFVSPSLSTKWIDTYNPRTGKVFARVPSTADKEVEDAIAAAERAFSGWSQTSKSARSSLMIRIADLINERKECFAIWESIDQGKSLQRARVEIDRAESNFRYFAGYILHDDNAVRMTDDDVLAYEHRSAAGVFALISPWNMPLYLLTWKMAPCLAFGCTAVAKPSEVTSMTAFLLAAVLRDSGLPAGVMNIVFGGGLPTGSALVKSPKVKGVSFTGGTATGIQIRRDTAADIGKHISLELGGKNPTLVFDVDTSKAVEVAAAAAFENQGEICLCGSRIFVLRSKFDDFVAQFTFYVKTNYELGGKVGAVVSFAHYQKIRSYILQAQSENARFHAGKVPVEKPQDGYWIEPTILTGLPLTSTVMTEEIFGPVVTITPFETEEEALRLANDNPNGLAAVLLTDDVRQMRRVGERLDAGLVWVNCWLVRQLGTPFGGMKISGTGREGGSYSRDIFTNVRTIHVPKG